MSQTALKSKPSGTRQIFNLIVLLLLIAVTAVRFLPSGREDIEISEEEAAIMLSGFDRPKPKKPVPPADEAAADPDQSLSEQSSPDQTIPGKTILGEKNHERLTRALEGMETQRQVYEELDPGERTEKEVVPFAIVLPEPVSPPQPSEKELAMSGTSERDGDESGQALSEETDPPPEEADRLTVPNNQATGIWVREQREGQNPIEIEDHASVNATQLAEMAKVRNLSTDPRYPPPNFDISAVGSGRMGTYVIAEGRMIRLNGELPAANTPPEAWRLTKATATEAHWMPVE